MYGIPNMKLDKEEVVLRRLGQLEQEGVKFVCNTTVGGISRGEAARGVRRHGPLHRCDAAARPAHRGAQPEGVHFAMEFLTANTKALLNGGADTRRFTRAARTVVVIGGGDTGTDCVGTSMRHGCRSLLQIEILPQAPLERAADNPWPEWPKTYKLDYGQEEAAAKSAPIRASI